MLLEDSVSHKYTFIPQHNLVHVHVKTHASRTLRHAYVDFETYLKSPCYQPNQDFLYDTDNFDFSHVKTSGILQNFPDIITLLQRYHFNSKIVFFAPTQGAFDVIRKIERLIGPHLTQPTLVARDFEVAKHFLNKPELDIQKLRQLATETI